MARQLNCYGEERPSKPVTLPHFSLPDIDDNEERRELAERLAEARTIRNGQEAWEEIGKAGSFLAWCKIGAALAIGRDHALRVTGANAPMGRRYTWTFSAWCKKHGFGKMRPATRSWCLALYENLPAIVTWRDRLPTGRGRRPPLNPQSCVKGWQRSLANGNGHAPQDWKREAIAAWQRFCFCVAALPENEAQSLWQIVQAKAVISVAAE
jgi:hypothetical protein